MRRRVTPALLVWLAVWQLPAATAVSFPPQETRLLVERQAYLMGTGVRLMGFAVNREAGLAGLDRALAALEDTDRELSTWRPDSPISVLNRTPVGRAWHASERLCRMFADLFWWRHATGGAFDPAVGAITDIWGIHERGRVPSASDLASARARSGSERLDFDRAACALTRKAEVRVDVGAFGKGEGLDRAAEALGGGDWMIDLGGQVSVGGSMPGGQPWTVDLADPADRQRAVARVQLRGGSFSTSGGSERDLRVDGRRIGHVLDPRTGEPAPFRGSVAVWHERALVADILSTALYVMGPDAGLRWAAAKGLHAAYLESDSGQVRIAATPGLISWIQPLSSTSVGLAVSELPASSGRE